MAEMILKARWVFPVTRVPIESGWVHIDGERIRAVGDPAERSPDINLGNVALIPGLVNPHTHLDLSGCHELAHRTEDFVTWLRAVIASRRSQDLSQTQASIQDGLRESLAAGVTLLGDIAGDGSSWESLAAAPMNSVVFRELIGLTESRAKEAETLADAWLHDHPATDRCRPGLSPHAPYSVRASLFEAVAKLAESHRCPVSIHIAESPAESELLADHDGPMRGFLEGLGVWDATGLIESHQSLAATFAHIEAMAWVHANQTPGGSLPSRIYCPRTHGNFGFDPYPLRECLAVGERIALGTDSLASNPDLDPLAEARFVRDGFPDIEGSSLLRMITLSGAELLGFGDVTGSLEPGKYADLVAIPLPDQESSDPHALLFDELAPIGERRTVWRGTWR